MHLADDSLGVSSVGASSVGASSGPPASSPASRLAEWNALAPGAAAETILPCCGSDAWAVALSAERPFADQEALLRASRRIWSSLPQGAWQQAFESHPRLGEQKPQAAATVRSLAWSSSEQSTAMAAEEAEKARLREANARYQRRFGRIFILCAQNRSTAYILAELERRMQNTPEAELQEAALQQAQITELRLKRWLTGA